MTKQEAFEQYKLIRDAAILEADDRVKHILSSGALDLGDIDGIAIGKILVCDAFGFASEVVTYPFHTNIKQIADNLKHF